MGDLVWVILFFPNLWWNIFSLKYNVVRFFPALYALKDILYIVWEFFSLGISLQVGLQDFSEITHIPPQKSNGWPLMYFSSYKRKS